MDRESREMLKNLYSSYLDLGGDILELKALIENKVVFLEEEGLAVRFSRKCVDVCMKRVQNNVKQHTDELARRTQALIEHARNRAED